LDDARKEKPSQSPIHCILAPLVKEIKKNEMDTIPSANLHTESYHGKVRHDLDAIMPLMLYR
jgi:hypothetical protein